MSAVLKQPKSLHKRLLRLTKPRDVSMVKEALSSKNWTAIRVWEAKLSQFVSAIMLHVNYNHLKCTCNSSLTKSIARVPSSSSPSLSNRYQCTIRYLTISRTKRTALLRVLDHPTCNGSNITETSTKSRKTWTRRKSCLRKRTGRSCIWKWIKTRCSFSLTTRELAYSKLSNSPPTVLMASREESSSKSWPRQYST